MLSKIVNGVCMFLAGGSVGWLVGLSSSPVIQGIITALTGLIVAVGSLYSGATALPAGMKASPPLLAMLLFGIAAGTSGGLYCRTHNWFGADVKWLKQQLEEAGVPQDVIHTHLSKLLLDTGGDTAGRDLARQRSGQLYASLPTEQCALYQAKEGDELVALMKSSASVPISNFAKRCEKHPECLKAFVEEILCRQ